MCLEKANIPKNIGVTEKHNSSLHWFGAIGADGQSFVHLFFKFGFLLLVGLSYAEAPTSQGPER